jgi:3-oxoacyl-[acyl-carrier-protein] synthase-1/3-oxoacyl-[acyl-carrier-protein] synthase II
MNRVEPVAVTGMGLITAAGGSLEDTLRALARQQCFPVFPPPFATAHTFPVFRCSMKIGEAGDFPSRRTAALARIAAREALSAAGFSRTAEPEGLRLGVVVGTSVGASLNFFNFYRAFSAGENPSLTEIEEYLAANPASDLGGLLHCSGPVQCVTNACSSGADAIGIGAGWIRSGLCDLVLAGGTDALSYISYAGFGSLRLPSPTGCRPFDARRDGLTLGEGAAFMLLESESSRVKRGTGARAFVAGYGTATDAHRLTAPHPDGRGLAAALDQAFAQAGAGWEDIAFINAHGTATMANDAAEGVFFARHCPSVPFIGTKGATGHTLGAAGAVEAVLAAAHLAAGELPPTPAFREPDPAIGSAPVSRPTPIEGRFALSQSLAFGGNNSVLLIAGGET